MKTLWTGIRIALLLGSLALPGRAFAQQVSVPVTPHQQEHSLSCEIAALKMALSTHGVSVSEKELIGRLAFDPTGKQPGVWGDPHKGFVGSIDGRMLISGYGVYAKPIAAVGSKYATTKVIEHGSPQQLASEIKKGNSVIIWGYYGTNRTVYSWKTPGGTPIKAIAGEHTRLVYGFDGPVTAPTRFYILDPAKSNFFSWSTEELMYNWSGLNHMAVSVAPLKK